jgi:hypothetical protein
MKQTSSGPVVESAEALSPHAKTVLEAGQKLLLESVEVGRQFCQAMVGVSLTAIPAYVGLLKLFLPAEQSPTGVAGPLWIVPVALFLLAAAVSVGGHLPGRNAISLDLLDEVETTLRRATSRRFWCGILAFGRLSCGIASSMLVLSKV